MGFVKPKFKAGDRFRFGAEGVVISASSGSLQVKLDENPWYSVFPVEYFEAHATLIEPPYEPQVGDIVEFEETFSPATKAWTLGWVDEVGHHNGNREMHLVRHGYQSTWMRAADMRFVARPEVAR